MIIPNCVFTGYQQGWFLEGQRFVPQVMPLGHPQANVVMLKVDCSLRSTLKWELPEINTWVMWQLVTDLFDQQDPDEPSLLSFELALDHLVHGVMPKFKTFGVILYQGLPCVSPQVLRSLAARLPDHVIPFIALDLSDYKRADQFFHALQREELSHIGLILKGGEEWPYAVPALGWDQPSVYGYYSDQPQTLLPEQRLPVALCYRPGANFSLPEAPCRVIPEELLTEEWDGIDTLYVTELSAKGQRKVQGLLATGAQVLQSVSK